MTHPSSPDTSTTSTQAPTGSACSEQGTEKAPLTQPKTGGNTDVPPGRSHTHVSPGSKAYASILDLLAGYDHMNYALILKGREGGVPEGLKGEVRGLMDHSLMWELTPCAFEEDDPKNDPSAAKLVYQLTGTLSDLGPKPWSRYSEQVKKLQAMVKNEQNYDFLRSSLDEVQKATERLVDELRGGAYDLTDPASRAEEAKTAIADALEWTQLLSAAEAASNAIFKQTKGHYGWKWELVPDWSCPPRWGVIGSVDEALAAVNKVEAPPWPGNSPTEEDFEKRREALIAATQNENKWSSELRASLEAFQNCATAPYTRLLTTIGKIGLALQDGDDHTEFKQGIEELSKIANSAMDGEDSAWKDRFRNLASIISDIETLGARVFSARPSEDLNSPEASDGNGAGV